MTQPGPDGAASSAPAGNSAGPTTTTQEPPSSSGQAQTPPAQAPSGPGSATPQGDPQQPATFPAPVVEQLRRENQQLRNNNNEFQQTILKALGVTTDGKPDADTLQKTLAARETEVRNLKIGNALSDVFSEAGVKPKLTRAVLNGEGLLEGLNPDDKDFGDKLKALVEQVVTANPELKLTTVTPPPAGSGAQNHSGNNGGPQQKTEDDLKTMTPEEIVKAQEDGLLNNLLGRV